MPLPDYVDYLKTLFNGRLQSVCKKSCPMFPLSLASVVRHIYLRPGVGVGALQKVYGGKHTKVVGSLCSVHQFS